MPKITLPKARYRRVNKRLPPGVCRVDQPSTRTHGYVVRLGHRPVKFKEPWMEKAHVVWRPKLSAYFGDHSHGGPAAALEACRRWIRYVVRHGKPPKRKLRS